MADHWAELAWAETCLARAEVLVAEQKGRMQRMKTVSPESIMVLTNLERSRAGNEHFRDLIKREIYDEA
jgi:hypothetical protein